MKKRTNSPRLGPLGAERMDWVHQALCKDVDPELFFPVGSTGPAASQIEAAKAVCSRCPVRLECLEWAVSTVQDSGVWGGLSEEERRALRRSRRRGMLRPLVVVAG